MSILKETIKHYKSGLFLNSLYQRLKETHATLYYLVEEGLFDKEIPLIEPRLSQFDFFQLDQSDISEIAAKPEKDYSGNDMLKMLSSGCGCFGVRHKGEIAAYMWYNLSQCSYQYLTFKLAEGEAYLYGARTLKSFRGKALAPYLRQKVYEHLASTGRTKLYSITMYENISSIMFKRKLKAKNLKLYLQIRILGRYKRLILLRKYK